MGAVKLWEYWFQTSICGTYDSLAKVVEAMLDVLGDGSWIYMRNIRKYFFIESKIDGLLSHSIVSKNYKLNSVAGGRDLVYQAMQLMIDGQRGSFKCQNRVLDITLSIF
jgi:hypothetical protein